MNFCPMNAMYEDTEHIYNRLNIDPRSSKQYIDKFLLLPFSHSLIDTDDIGVELCNFDMTVGNESNDSLRILMEKYLFSHDSEDEDDYHGNEQTICILRMNTVHEGTKHWKQYDEQSNMCICQTEST